jgi:hypothetical protein
VSRRLMNGSCSGKTWPAVSTAGVAPVLMSAWP